MSAGSGRFSFSEKKEVRSFEGEMTPTASSHLFWFLFNVLKELPVGSALLFAGSQYSPTLNILRYELTI